MLIKRLSFFQNTDKFYGLADSAFTSLFRFGCGLMIARLGTTNDFSVYILLITTAVIFQQIPNTAYLIPMLNRGTGVSPEELKTLKKWAQFGITKAIGTFAIICLGGILFLRFSLSPLIAFAFIAATASQLFIHYYRSLLQIKFRQRQSLFINIAVSFSHLLISGGLLLFTEYSILFTFWMGAAIAGAIGVLTMHLSTLSLEDSNDNSSSRDLIESAQNDGRAMLKGSIANTACSRTQPYVLSLLTNPEVLAYYGAIWTLVGPVRLLSMALSNLMRPRLALHHNKKNPAAFNRSFKFALGTIIPLGLAASLFTFLGGEWIVNIVFGSNLAPAGKWLGLGMLYATLDATTSCQMIAIQIRLKDGPKISSNLRIKTAILSLMLLAPLTIYFGLTGTLSSLAIAEFYYLISATQLTSKKAQIKKMRFFREKKYNNFSI